MGGGGGGGGGGANLPIVSGFNTTFYSFARSLISLCTAMVMANGEGGLELYCDRQIWSGPGGGGEQSPPPPPPHPPGDTCT